MDMEILGELPRRMPDKLCILFVAGAIPLWSRAEEGVKAMPGNMSISVDSMGLETARDFVPWVERGAWLIR
jgi:hypothetical protein